MRLNNGYSHASIISGFILFFFCVIFGLEVLTRGIISVKLVHQMPPISHHRQFIVYLAFSLTSLFTSEKKRGLCLMSLSLYRFLHVHVLLETNGVSFILSCLFQKNASVLRNDF